MKNFLKMVISIDRDLLKMTKNQFFGKCWDSKFDDNSFNIIFTSHTLEHVPHFSLEKTTESLNNIDLIAEVSLLSFADVLVPCALM